MSTSILRHVQRSALSRIALTQRSYSTSQPPRHKRSLGTLAAVTVASLVAGTLGAIYPPPPLSILFPRAAPGPPAEPDSPESQAYSSSLEEQLQELEALQQLRRKDDAREWYETRPYQDFPEERRVNNLTAGALRGPGKLALRPLIRARRDESESVVFIHLGRGLCGHDGIIHGGLLATLLDETLARTAISNLPEKVGVTATLSLNYRAPTMADQFVVIKTQIQEVKGRKATVTGRVEDLMGTVLVEASAMFVQPRYAKLLHSAQLRKAMGEPPSEEAVLLADGQDLNPGHKHR
ncbi:Thioesterase/thiol ester dehydrase-isomerase [Pholiota conissans]|uniref:Thioesterase/thiol ester dehydrase-isomerase n=1 Tax=Pholiota conissans TaxID=109636 RepID=A0A9P5Z8U2_9AGAR|nr:Thioesterase/thiol ester dehydrase-isomerase [Pholiota conissans]